jgi:hypothetical protein
VCLCGVCFAATGADFREKNCHKHFFCQSNCIDRSRIYGTEK